MALATVVLAADSNPKCGVGSGKCPSDTPCCSQYGECGIGGYCLGGCDPKFSTTLDACTPEPQCQNLDSTFANLDRVADKTKYLGDSSKYDWVADGTPLQFGGNLLLTMDPQSVGTVLASTTYVWYGKISATMKTSRGRGVVSAFILLSDMKDEIDFEWVGADLETTQTNYYWQGVPNYNHGGNISNSDTFENFHTYEIDWQPDQITWSVDGQIGRTLKKSDTFNETTKQYDYPQTPARVQLSLWPGGLSTNDAGTIAWAGGEIDWNSQDIQKFGYYYATFKEVKITCYDPPSDAVGSGKKSYMYNDEAGLENNVVMSDNATVLASFANTGYNMTAKPPKASASGTNSAQPSATDTSGTVPGLDNSGTVGTGSDSTRGGSSDEGVTSGGSSSSSSGGGDDGGSEAGDGTSTFQQGSDTSTTGKAGSEATQQRVTQGSVLAVVIAAVAMMVL